MYHKESNVLRQWLGLLLGAILLAICLIALNVQQAAAQAAPPIDRNSVHHNKATTTGRQAIEMTSLSPQGLLPVNSGFTVDLTYDAIWGLVSPGDVVTVTRPADGAYGAGQADGVGFFWTRLWFSNGQPADIAGGDTMDLYVNGGLAATLSPLAITGGVDVLADEVNGNVAGLGMGTAVTVTLGDLGSMPADEPRVVTDVVAGGDFEAEFGGVADIGPHMMAQVQYRDGSGNTVQAYLYPSQVFRVYGWNAVEGYADTSSTVTVTVYMTYPTDVRWSGQALAGWPHGVYGVYPEDYGGAINYGDVVEVELGGGTIISVTADYLEMLADADTDEITGLAPANSTVRGQVWDSFAGFYSDDTVVADGGGNFTLDLGVDLQTAQWPYVTYVDAEGDEVGYGAPPPHIRAYPPSAGVYAVADGPNQPVTYTLDTGAATTTVSAWCGRTNTCGWAYFDSVEPGHVITAEFAGGEMVMEVADVSLEPDTANDSITGDAPPGRLDVSADQFGGGQYPAHGAGLTTTVTSSPFVVTFPGFDVRDRMTLYAYYYDAVDGNRTMVWRGNWDTAFFEVQRNGVWGTPPHADEVVTATLYTEGGVELASTNADGDDSPWYFWLDDFGGYDIQPGRWVTITSESGWTAGVQVPILTIEADDSTDMIWGQGPKAQLFIDGGYSELRRWVPCDDYALDTGFLGVDLQQGDYVATIYQAPNGDGARTEFYWPQIRMDVNYGHQWVEVETVPGATVTVTVAGKATVTGQADGGGWFQTYNWSWDPEQPRLEPGDVVTATAIGLTTTVHPVGAIDAVANSDTDVVSGTVQAPWFPTVTVACEVWTWGGPSIVITDVNGAGGTFLCDFGAIGWDLVAPGPSVMVRYWEPDGDAVINEAQFLDLIMNVNYGHDWIEGNYEPGHTVWLTVTDEFDTIKATVQLQTQEIPWWGGRTGFSTNVEDLWVPGQPDIETGDYVHGRVDNGFAGSVRVGTITGDLDMDTDTVSGNVYANWFSGLLNANCGIWEENGPGQDFQVDLDTGGAYSCDFGAMGWDLLPGQNVGVQYQEPDGDWVMNVFREPAPDMRVEKWTEGGGEVSPGGPVVYTIRYRNDGDGPAGTVWLTDTLPASTSYVDDTSGFVATVGGGQVVWSFGPVDPGEEAQFQLVLTNTATSSDTLHNVADIDALYDWNQDNNHAEADVHVAPGQPDLYVNKNPNPGDPTTGQTMLWEINYGNNGPVASGPVVLTDTIPHDTSIVGWRSENGYGLWADHSSAGQLILEAPTIPANWGDRILLRLLVGASSGTQLTNTVEIATANDSDLSNNWHRRDDVWVSEPRWDSFVDKSFGWGRLVPGGEMEYNLHVRNSGNVAAYTLFTDTLPAGTSFDQSWNCTEPTCVPFPPDYVDNQIAVWDLGTMEPGEYINFNIRLSIDGDVEPGTVLTNCAEVTIDGDDGWPDNNIDCVADMIHDFGPNLRIDKYYQWNWEGQLEYTIEFRNVGSTTLHDVNVADTLPAGTTFSGNWWHWFSENIDFNQVGDQLVWTISRLDPTWSAGLRYQVDLNGDIVGQEGLCFTNMAEAPIPDDVWPNDNYDQVTACTGPDVYVEKWLGGGEPRPGAIVTFTVQFGNQNRWPWDGDAQYGSHVTDTLPAGMTFITATAPWNPHDVWHPETIDDNTIVWSWGPMWNDNRWRFDLVAQIADTVEGGDVLTNVVEAYGDSPNDVEPNYDNNVFELPVTILGPSFTVQKAYQSSKVAGTPVTYTLTVINVGNEPATTVLLGDEVPAGVTYGGGSGTLVSGSVNWTFGSIAAGGTGTGWFWGTLACAGTVTNDAYRVISSDQGVDTPDGSPVSFTIVAPTLLPSFDQSAAQVNIGELVHFSDTSTTDGGAIAAWGWDFGDGRTASGAAVSHAYAAPGSYDVTLTITDTCGYAASTTIPDAVTIAQYRRYLPTILRGHTP